MKLLGLIVLCGTLTGCGAVEAYVDGVSGLFKTSSQKLDEMAINFDRDLGKPKEARIQRLGLLPERCMPFGERGEACSWRIAGVSVGREGGGSWQHNVTYFYDTQGLAQSWTYWGSFGRRSSSDPKPYTEPVPVSKPE